MAHPQIEAEALQFMEAVKAATHHTHGTRSSPPVFHASAHFVTRFKRKHRLSSHRTAVKHVSRVERGRDMELEKLAFILEVRDAVEEYGASLVLNMDETPVMLLDVPVTAVVSTGCGQAAQVHSTAGSLGSKITTFPTISAAGDKLQLCAVIKGKTLRCLRSVEDGASADVQKVRLYYSEKGWTNEGIMLRWLAEVVQPYTRSRPAALLLDSFPAHFTDAVVAAAAAMHLRLIQVPAGTTAELQPLDVGFNGALLMKRKQLWAQLKLSVPSAEDTRQRAIERAQQAYAAQPKATAVRAFREALLID
jgi:hypothetical protein